MKGMPKRKRLKGSRRERAETAWYSMRFVVGVLCGGMGLAHILRLAIEAHKRAFAGVQVL